MAKTRSKLTISDYNDLLIDLEEIVGYDKVTLKYHKGVLPDAYIKFANGSGEITEQSILLAPGLAMIFEGLNDKARYAPGDIKYRYINTLRDYYKAWHISFYPAPVRVSMDNLNVVLWLVVKVPLEIIAENVVDWFSSKRQDPDLADLVVDATTLETTAMVNYSLCIAHQLLTGHIDYESISSD